MDFFSILGIANLLNNYNKARHNRKFIWMEQNIYEITSDLEYFLNMINKYRR